MRTYILLLITVCFSMSGFAQLSSLVTSRESEAMGKFTEFIIVDVATQYVVAKDPVKYDSAKEMPSCYFTTVLGDLTGIVYGNKYRNLVINTRVGVDNDCFVVAENEENRETIFSRRKFLADYKGQYCWVPYVDGDYVVFLNLKGASDSNWGGYLSMTEEGRLRSVKTFAEASRFKIIKE